MYDLSTPCRTTRRWHGGNRDWVGRTRISILTAFFTCSVQLSSFPVSLTLLFLSLFWFLINATWWVVYSRPCFRARLPRRRGRLWFTVDVQHAQRTHGGMITSSLRQNDVVTSFWRNNDRYHWAACPLGNRSNQINPFIYMYNGNKPLSGIFNLCSENHPR